MKDVAQGNLPTLPPDTTFRSRWSLSRANQEPAEPVFRGLARVVRGILTLSSRRHWYGSENLPSSGGIVVVSNHMGYMDALILGEYMIWSGRWPRFLGKAELWKVPVVGWLARSCGQIPVHRRSARAGEALNAAEVALVDGKAVTIFPEGTETYDPDLWPMSAHTGAARLALKGNWPVIPIAQWGAHRIMPGRRPTFPRLFPPKDTAVVCGEPVDLDDLRVHVGTPRENEATRAATERIMDAITRLLAELRQEEPPAEGRWNRKLERRVPSQPTLEA